MDTCHNKKSTTHRPARKTAAAGQGCIDGAGEDRTRKTGSAGLVVGGGKHLSPLRGGLGWGGGALLACYSSLDTVGNAGRQRVGPFVDSLVANANFFGR